MFVWRRALKGTGKDVALAVTLIGFLLYIVVFIFLFPQMGSSVAALSLLPVLLSGWMLGMRAGLASGILTICLNTLLLNLGGETGWDVVLRAGGGPGSIAILLAGIAAGWVRTLYEHRTQEIRARQRAETALRQSEGYFRTLFEESPLGISLVDAENRFVRVNDRLCEMLGYPAQELMALTFVDITHPEDVEADLGQSRRLLAGEILRFDMEKRYIRKDGRALWIQLTVTTIQQEGERTPYFLGMVEDIDERKQAERALQRRDRILEAVAFAAQSLLHGSSWEDEIETVLGRLGEAAGASRVLVLQYEAGDDQQPQPRFEWTRAGVPAVGPTQLAWRPSPANEVTWGQALRAGEAVIGRREHFSPPLQEMLARRQVQALAIVPVFASERMWGLLSFDRIEGGRAWSKLEIEALKAAASTLGAAIYRYETEAQVYRRNRELQLLNRVVVTAASKIEPAVVLETVSRELAQAFDVPQAGAALLDASGEALEVVAEYMPEAGISAIGERIPLAGNLATQIVMREKRPLVIGNAQEDARMEPVHDLMRRRNVASMILLPLQTNGHVVGTIGLDAPTPKEFSEEEVRLAATAAAAAAQVLEKAKLLQQTRDQAAQLAALHDVQLAISHSLEPQRVYQAIVQHAARLVPCAAACLFYRDERTGGHVRLASYGEPVPGGTGFWLPDEGGAQEPLDKPVTVVLPAGRAGREAQSALLVPLRYRDRVTGFLGFRHREGTHRWPAEEVALAEALTAQAAVAVANARLHAQTQADAETVQQILETIPDGVILLDDGHEVIRANPQGYGYLHLLAGDADPALQALGGKRLAAFLEPPPSGQAGHEVRLEAGRTRIFEIRAATAPEGWVLVVREVTHEREQQRQLQAQERLAAVGQLSAGIAHDFNNILAVIVLYAQLLQREPLPPHVLQRLGAIYEQAQHASHLVQQILDFSRKAVIKRETFDLLPFMREQVELLTRTLPEMINVDFQYEPGRYPLRADATRLQQAVMNLALNARDAMADGGRLRFSLTRLLPREGLAQGAATAGEWIRLEVSDGGTGIKPEHLPHIFEPFYTTKGPGEGSGLGLAQVYGIVKQHGGHIEVESAGGQGTTFTLYFPLAGPAADSRPRAGGVRRGPPAHRASGSLPPAR